jgi:hypothetical protein
LEAVIAADGFALTKGAPPADPDTHIDFLLSEE